MNSQFNYELGTRFFIIGRFAFLSIDQGMALLQGGVPIEIDGQVLGAIGVSGVKASDDEGVALAGVNALKAALS